MSGLEAFGAPLAVRLCGTIRPAKSNTGNCSVTIRHFVASGVVVFDGRAVWLSVRENQIFAAIVGDQSRTQRQSIITFIGESEADGGPETIDSVATQIIVRLKTKLQSIGVDLVRNGNQHAPFVIRRVGHA